MAVFEARQLKPNVGLFNYSLFCIRGRDSLLDAKFTYFVTVEIFFHRGGNSLLGTIGEKNKRDPPIYLVGFRRKTTTACSNSVS